MANISSITLPVGNSTVTYTFADATVRQTLAGGLSFVVCWDGEEPVVANIPEGVVVTYQGTEYTGTKAASTAAPLTFYLVKSATQVGSLDAYDEYVSVGNPQAWQKLGSQGFDFSDLKALAFKDNVVLEKGSGHNVMGSGLELEADSSEVEFTTAHTKRNVLGVNTTFAGQDSSVTITGGSTKKALGTSTTFKATTSDVEFAKKTGTDDPDHSYGDALGANATFTTSVTPTTQYLKATATDMAVASDGNEAEALTGFGSHTPGTFYDQAAPETKYLETVEVYGTDGTENVSQVSMESGDAAYLELASVPKVKYADNEYKTGTADTWAFNYDSSNGMLEITGANGTAMELESADATVATGATQSSSTNAGSAIVKDMTITNVDVAKVAASPVTLATGSLTASEDGAEVVYDLNTDTDSAITALGEEQTADALTGVVATDPTVSLELVNAAISGKTVEVATAISAANVSTTVNNQDKVTAITGLASATAKAQTVTPDSKVEVNAVTAIGTATAAGQAVTVGTNDLVSVFTQLGSAQAQAQTITVETADTVKVAEYNDLDINVE